MAITADEVRDKGVAVRDRATAVWVAKVAPALLAVDADDLREFTFQIRDAFDFIVTMFESHTRRDPAAVDEMRSYFENLRRTLDEPAITGAIDTVKDYVSGWRGDASYNFRENFLEPLEEIHHNQRYLANMLDASLEAIANMLTNGRADIIDIGDAALAALDAVAESVGGSAALTLGLTVVAGAATALSGVPTGGATLVFATLAGAATIGAGVVSYQGSGSSMTGASVEEVINNLVEANNALWESKDTVERDLADKLNEDLTTVRLERHKFQPPRPNINGFGSSEERSDQILDEFVPPA